MTIFFAKHPLLRKGLASFAILVIFMLGRRIPLPNVTVQGSLNASLEAAANITGASLSQIGLFSLGLGPMMAGMILSQLFSLGKRNRVVSPQVAQFRKNSIVLVVALIQGLSMALSFSYSGQEGFLEQVLVTTALLITGAFVIIWLSELNGKYGFGGPMLIMLASILLGQFSTIPTVISLWEAGDQMIVLGFGVWMLLVILLMVILDKAEYRIPIQRISIHNKYAEKSYIPIKPNIAGGMPIMYAMTFMTFPVYVLMLISLLFPDLAFLQNYMVFFNTTNIYGVSVYLLIIAILTIAMAFVNVDVVSLAEGLRGSGDYIPFVRPGKETRRYINYYIWVFAILYSIYLVLMSGLPMLYSLYRPDTRALSGLTGVVMMTAGIIIGLIEEVGIMRLKKKYVSIFKKRG